MQYSWSCASCVYEFFICPALPFPLSPPTPFLPVDLRRFPRDRRVLVLFTRSLKLVRRSTRSICFSGESEGETRVRRRTGEESRTLQKTAFLWIIRLDVCGRQNKEPRKERTHTTERPGKFRLSFPSVPLSLPSRRGGDSTSLPSTVLLWNLNNSTQLSSPSDGVTLCSRWNGLIVSNDDSALRTLKIGTWFSG